MADQSDIQRRYREFLDLMPLTMALAGLPPSDAGKYYTAEQIESRAYTIRHAWKMSRQVVRECVAGGGSYAGEA